MSHPAVSKPDGSEHRRSGARSALLVIDMQTGLFETGDRPFEGERVLENINALIRSARAAGVPILAARHVGPAGSPLAPDNPATRLLDRLDVDPARDHVFTKTRPNCFSDSALADALARAGAEELVIVGMKTQFCVDTTCRAAADRGLRVVLVADAHTCTDTPVLAARQIVDHHNATLQAFARVVRTADWRFGLDGA